MEYHYFTRQDELKKEYNSLVRMKKNPVIAMQAWEIDINNALTLKDWLELVQSDAPGTYCVLTPQDLVKRVKMLRGMDRREKKE